MTSDRRSLLLLLSAFLCAVLCVASFVLREEWLSPGIVTTPLTLNYAIGDRTYTTQVSCDHPRYLIENQGATLDLAFSTAATGGEDSHRPTPKKNTATAATTPLPTSASPASAVTTTTTTPGTGGLVEGEVVSFWLQALVEGRLVTFPDGFWNVAAGSSQQGLQGSFAQIILQPTKQNVRIDLRIGAARPNNEWFNQNLAQGNFNIETRASWPATLYLSAFFLLAFGFVSSIALLIRERVRAGRIVRQADFEHEKELAQKTSEGAGFAWLLAKKRLENYFDRNLFQVNLVFWTSTVVMIAGFVVVVWAVNASLTPTAPASTSKSSQPGFSASLPQTTPAASSPEGAAKDQLPLSPGVKIAAGAGLITQFLGATFMVLYRSTMKQANDYILVLDRINNVGMAMQVLEQVPENPHTVKNQIRAKIIDRLLSLGHTDLPLPEPEPPSTPGK